MEKERMERIEARSRKGKDMGKGSENSRKGKV